MALSDTRLRTLKPKEQTFSESDGGGLYIEVMPTGKKRWGLKYRTIAAKQETDPAGRLSRLFVDRSAGVAGRLQGTSWARPFANGLKAR